MRLLHDAGVVGGVHSERSRAQDNLLIRGDALNALTSLAKLPELAREYLGKIKLAYLDPPFNTQQAFEQYDDALEHSVWLTMLRDRLAQIKRLLRDDGSVWVHCDDSEQAYLKVTMDELFGRENFAASIIWEKFATRDNRPPISISHDYILVYARNLRSWRRNLLPFGDEQRARYKNPDKDPRGPWASLPIHAQGGHGTAAQFYTLTLPSGRKLEPPPGNCWRFTEARLKQLVADNRISFGPKGDNAPRLKSFLSEVAQGLVPRSLWLGAEVGITGTAKAEIVALFPGLKPFATPKPERLMERIVRIATNPGDIVLDCFLGSGTTAAVAHKMGRRWVGVERSETTLETFALPRLQKVVEGKDPGGITGAVNWSGGGGFRILDVAPSMFAEDAGLVVLADWAVGGHLAEATSAQLGFEYADDAPFAGRKGRSRLAVIDGLVNGDVCRLLVDRLDANERLVVCGTAVDPDAQDQLTAMSSGSRVRKIPASILSEYRLRARRVFRTLEPTSDGAGAVGAAGEEVKA